jgi:hypothetical protein
MSKCCWTVRENIVNVKISGGSVVLDVAAVTAEAQLQWL